MGKPKEELRGHFLIAKLNDLEVEISNRVAKSLHISKSEMVRMLIWTKYDELCKRSFISEEGMYSSIPETIEELQEVQ